MFNKTKIIMIAALLSFSPIPASAAYGDTGCIEKSECAGDEIDIIDAMTTKQSEATSAQINFRCSVPDEFSQSIYVEIENVDSKSVYSLPLYKDNNYEQRCFVSEGNYKILEISAYDDVTGTYKFSYPEDFSVDKNETVDLSTALITDSDDISEISSDVSLMEANDPSESSDFKVFHDGEGKGIVSITGTQKSKYDLSIEISSTGLPGGMSVNYSLDGGKNWNGVVEVPLHTKLPIYETDEHGNKMDSGLTAVFSVPEDSDAAPFIKGDVYYSYIPDPKTDVIYEHEGDGSVEIELVPIDDKAQIYDLLKKHDVGFVIKVLKGGLAGDAVIEISIDGGKSFMEERFVPKGNLVFKDLGLKLTFPQADSFKLKEGDIYRFYAYKKSYLKAYILGGVMILLLLAGGLLFCAAMKSRLPDESDYHILMPYVCKIPDKRNHK